MKINKYIIITIIFLLLAMISGIFGSEIWPLIYFITAIVVFFLGEIINTIKNFAK